ncbi:MAG: hypothetical protein AUH30_00880 [Candidatus Rokubacteria bacterium 13_1_40CM_68_15]|nr:MAG: hypothetical protein AUH30_00880 [Candidatus Rokubacteria bacterium 13_1_40CM_68_15]
MQRIARRFSWLFIGLIALVGILCRPSSGYAVTTAANPLCPEEVVFYNPGNGEDIVVPSGFRVSVFVKDLNFPVAVAFRGSARKFDVYVLESGHGLPSRCNDEEAFQLAHPTLSNPFTPDILVFDQSGTKIAPRPLGKPTDARATNETGGTNVFQPHGPAVDIAFENGFDGGRLFATDSNQSLRTTGRNNSSRIVTVNPDTGRVTPFITGLPTGDHPAEQITFKDGWIYWSQGSTTNSGVVGHDNGGGDNQQDIPCQTIKLSDNTFDSGDGHFTSGYSPHNVARPGAIVPAFESATGPGICDGAILRARLNARNPKDTIEPFSWGYRNPYGIRFAPNDHALKGRLLVTENGEDERGARPTNNAPDRLHVAQQNPDGSPDYHGWPDRFGFLDSTQAVFNPVGGPGDDLCGFNAAFSPPCTPASLTRILAEDRPVKPLFAFPPQPITAPLALEPADVAIVGLDFVPDSFVGGPVKRGAALAGREGDFGFSKANGTPEEGHDVQLINFSSADEPLRVNLQRFAHNTTFEQAFVAHTRGINRPVDLKFGPDNCAYLVDYGAVRDFGQSDPDSKFIGPANGPLVQIPGTGVIWKICRTAAQDREDRNDRRNRGDRDD